MSAENKQINPYAGKFDNWEDVIFEFNGVYDFSDDSKKQKIRELYPEPEVVLHAEYGGGGYDGDAVVAYYDNRKFYTVEGSHCSCYGLEDQWQPEEYEPDIFIAALDRKIENAYNEAGDYPSSSKLVWKLIKSRAEKIIGGAS